MLNPLIPPLSRGEVRSTGGLTGNTGEEFNKKPHPNKVERGFPSYLPAIFGKSISYFLKISFLKFPQSSKLTRTESNMENKIQSVVEVTIATQMAIW